VTPLLAGTLLLPPGTITTSFSLLLQVAFLFVFASRILLEVPQRWRFLLEIYQLCIDSCCLDLLLFETEAPITSKKKFVKGLCSVLERTMTIDDDPTAVICVVDAIVFALKPILKKDDSSHPLEKAQESMAKCEKVYQNTEWIDSFDGVFRTPKTNFIIASRILSSSSKLNR
jgi:hypothetical protein